MGAVFARDCFEAAATFDAAESYKFTFIDMVLDTGEHITVRRTEKGWKLHDPAGDYARAVGLEYTSVFGR